jgi:ketosteroid isomerase-like protein
VAEISDKDAILAANAAFYAAFSAGTFEELARIWAEDDDISCIHPGWPSLVGRSAVIASWRDILLNPDRPRIRCREPYAIVTGDNGYVLCVEVIGPMALAASNYFKRVGSAWRLIHHQSSPIAQIVSEASPDTPPPGRQIH